jgi:N,N'-diacetyllegionaminate synthase
MSNLTEVANAVGVLKKFGAAKIALLHCVSNYPAAASDVNLCAMDTLAKAFNVPVGYSDHVPNNAVAFAAVARGACIIEKHFTLDRNLPGPDHKASIEPDELVALVEGIRIVESALGDGEKRIRPNIYYL